MATETNDQLLLYLVYSLRKKAKIPLIPIHRPTKLESMLTQPNLFIHDGEF